MAWHKARKRFGQNFLHDQNIIAKIVAAINPQANQHIVEIGPGQGAITQHLVANCQSFKVIEIDRDLVPLLKQSITQLSDTDIIQADALQVDFCKIRSTSEPLHIVGNLPYNISTPLLFHLFNFGDCIASLHFMLQREVVERIVATPASKNYGRLSIMTQYFCKPDYLFRVAAGCFKPIPKVESAFLRLTPHSSPPSIADDFSRFAAIVRLAFNQRRKTLRNALKDTIAETTFDAVGLSPKQRAEELTVADFVNLSNYKH